MTANNKVIRLDALYLELLLLRLNSHKEKSRCVNLREVLFLSLVETWCSFKAASAWLLNLSGKHTLNTLPQPYYLIDCE